MKKLFKDLMYNALYQVFLIILPLLTTPILSRRIGSEGLGVYGIVFSIAQFLMVFISVGMNPYRVRRIAKVREDKFELTQEFWNIFYMQLLMGIGAILVYVLIIVTLDGSYQNLYLIQLFFVLGTTLDIVWFFQGIEEFSKVVLRNTLIKIFSVVLIIFFVKTRNDLSLYVFITSIINFLGSIVFWGSLKNKVFRPSFDFNLFRSLWKPGFGILIPQLVMQVYTTLDKTIVGLMTTPTEVSYYDQSQKIARIILSLLSSVTIVMLPKLTRSMNLGDFQRVVEYTKKSVLYTLVISVILCNIVMVNTEQFVIWFFGREFAPMTAHMFLVSLIIIFSPLGGIFSNQFALAMEKDKAFAFPFFLGAMISLIGNFLTVPYLGSFGATIVLIVVEFMVCLSRIFVVKRDLPLKEIFNDQVRKFLLFSVLCIVLTSLFLPNIVSNVLANMIIKSLLIGIIYIVFCILVMPEIKNDFMDLYQRKKNSM